MQSTPPLSSTFPSPRDDDDEDVHWALSTAAALWARGERNEALRWLRRAAETASDANADERALELFKAAAEVASALEARPSDEENKAGAVASTAPPAAGTALRPESSPSPGPVAKPITPVAPVAPAALVAPVFVPTPAPQAPSEGSPIPDVRRLMVPFPRTTPAPSTAAVSASAPTVPGGSAALTGAGPASTRPPERSTGEATGTPIPTSRPAPARESSPTHAPPATKVSSTPATIFHDAELGAEESSASGREPPPPTPTQPGLGAEPFGHGARVGARPEVHVEPTAERTAEVPAFRRDAIAAFTHGSRRQGGLDERPVAPPPASGIGVVAPPVSQGTPPQATAGDRAGATGGLPPERSAGAPMDEPNAGLRRGDDEITMLRDFASLGIRVDDLDDETRVLASEGEPVRTGLPPRRDDRARSAGTSSRAFEDPDATPGADSEPAAVTSRGAPAWPDSSPGETPFSTLVAFRVAIAAGLDPGELHVMVLAPGASPPPGAAAAILVPASDADGERVARLLGLPRS